MRWFKVVTPSTYANGVLVATGISALAFGAGLGAGLIGGNVAGGTLLFGCTGAFFAWMTTMDNVAQERRAYWLRTHPEQEAEPEPEKPVHVPHLSENTEYDPNLNAYVLRWRGGKGKKNRQPAYAQTIQPLGVVTVDQNGDGSDVLLIDVNLGVWRMAKWMTYKKDGSEDLTEAYWINVKDGGQKVFRSVYEFRAVRSFMIAQKYGSWKDPDRTNSGWFLTSAGRSVIRYLRGREGNPLPRREIKYNRAELA